MDAMTIKAVNLALERVGCMNTCTADEWGLEFGVTVGRMPDGKWLVHEGRWNEYDDQGDE